jgi:hypothetical protein
MSDAQVAFLLQQFGSGDSTTSTDEAFSHAAAMGQTVFTEFGTRGFSKPVASNTELQGIIDKLYQDTDVVPGGTAGAARYEAATGKLLSPAGHWQDAADTAKELNTFLKSKPDLSTYDQNLVKVLIHDLESAAATKP